MTNELNAFMQNTLLPEHGYCVQTALPAMGGSFFGAHMNGTRNMLVITGNPILTGERGTIGNVFHFNSYQLMNYFRQLNIEYYADAPIIYGGALNHNRPNLDVEIGRMHKKSLAGADYFLTQPIFSDNDITRIKYIKTKINTKILCGIIPLAIGRSTAVPHSRSARGG